MKLITGKDEIVCLLTKVLERYERNTRQEVIRNTNRKNYESVARVLSDISAGLPETTASLEHEPYPPDPNPTQEYPYRKYDITAGQVKDAYAGMVTNPRPFLVDACYIYVFGKGRRGFEKNPTDTDLLKSAEALPASNSIHPLQQEYEALQEQVTSLQKEQITIQQQVADLGSEKVAVQQQASQQLATTRRQFGWIVTFLLFTLGINIAYLLYTRHVWNTLRTDMRILPYQPTPAEISRMEGVWLCHTGSPQARSSEPNRYHVVVSNLVNIHYKNGYFLFERYGASFDFVGYIQFEAAGLVSIHSFVKTHQGTLEWPRHSLLRLDSTKSFLNSISASWNFDIAGKNDIIGIREVYEKIGQGGQVEEIINTIENSSCHCKIVRWNQESGKSRFFYLKNYSIDSLANPAMRKLIDEKSIILREPQEGIVLTDSGAVFK